MSRSQTGSDTGSTVTTPPSVRVGALLEQATTHDRARQARNRVAARRNGMAILAWGGGPVDQPCRQDANPGAGEGIQMPPTPVVAKLRNSSLGMARRACR